MENKKFIEWLQRQGAEVLAPTNPYEVARFRARGGVHVVYEGRRGINANGFAEECLEAFRKHQNIDMGITQKPRTPMARVKVALVQRDGKLCFFCGAEMPESDMTVEHLVSIHKGGPNHMDNLALAHERCNRTAANFPLVEKIRMHVAARITGA